MIIIVVISITTAKPPAMASNNFENTCSCLNSQNSYNHGSYVVTHDCHGEQMGLFLCAWGARLVLKMHNEWKIRYGYCTMTMINCHRTRKVWCCTQLVHQRIDWWQEQRLQKLLAPGPIICCLADGCLEQEQKKVNSWSIFSTKKPGVRSTWICL